VAVLDLPWTNPVLSPNFPNFQQFLRFFGGFVGGSGNDQLRVQPTAIPDPPMDDHALEDISDLFPVRFFHTWYIYVT